MKTLEYTNKTVHDKQRWGKGPWLGEPDKKQWQDRKTGLPCLAVRNHMGGWCGYVGVPEGHPCFNKTYDEVESGKYDDNYDKLLVEPIAPELSVHGGLTYAGFCQPGPEDEAICHLVESGENDHVWWLGFDCGHSNDYLPSVEQTLREAGHYEKYPQYDPLNKDSEFNQHVITAKYYRTLRYVEDEVKSLARQLAKLK